MNEKLLPAAVYLRRSCRLSSDRSCDDQLTEVKKMMLPLGYTIVHVADIFEDDLKSGMLFFKRPAMGALLEMFATPKPLDPPPYAAIFVDDLSRVARNLAFTVLFVQLLRFHGIKLYDSKGVDYTTIQGYCLAILLGIVSEIGRTFLSQQTSRGIRSALKRNRKPGALFGFRPVKKGIKDE